MSTTPDHTPAAATGTDYVILKVVHGDAQHDLYGEVGRRMAASAEQAIRQFVEGRPDNEGLYVAVPARSWKPVKVATKTETRLVLEDA